LLASFKVAYRISIIMLPAAIDIVERMLSESCAKELWRIPLAETVGRRISDISEDFCD
jgi:hypothetical protein